MPCRTVHTNTKKVRDCKEERSLDGGSGLASSKSLLSSNKGRHAINHGLHQLHLRLAKALLVGNVIHPTLCLRVLAVDATRL